AWTPGSAGPQRRVVADSRRVSLQSRGRKPMQGGGQLGEVLGGRVIPREIAADRGGMAAVALIDLVGALLRGPDDAVCSHDLFVYELRHGLVVTVFGQRVEPRLQVLQTLDLQHRAVVGRRRV